MKLLYPSLFATTKDSYHDQSSFLKIFYKYFINLCIALGGNIQAGSLQSNCNLNGQTEITFNYEPADVDLGFAFVGASNSTTCGHGTNRATLTKTNDQLGSYSLTFDRFYCGYEGDIFSEIFPVKVNENLELF